MFLMETAIIQGVHYKFLYFPQYIDRLSIIRKSDMTDKMKRSFLPGSGRTLTKRLKKKLDGNYTRMLRAILNKS